MAKKLTEEQREAARIKRINRAGHAKYLRRVTPTGFDGRALVEEFVQVVRAHTAANDDHE